MSEVIPSESTASSSSEYINYTAIVGGAVTVAFMVIAAVTTLIIVVLMLRSRRGSKDMYVIITHNHQPFLHVVFIEVKLQELLAQ